MNVERCSLEMQQMTKTSVRRYETPGEDLIDFPVEEVILLLARTANAADRTPD